MPLGVEFYFKISVEKFTRLQIEMLYYRKKNKQKKKERKRRDFLPFILLTLEYCRSLRKLRCLAMPNVRVHMCRMILLWADDKQRCIVPSLWLTLNRPSLFALYTILDIYMRLSSDKRRIGNWKDNRSKRKSMSVQKEVSIWEKRRKKRDLHLTFGLCTDDLPS